MNRSFGDAVRTCRVTILHGQDVYVLKNVQIDSYMCAFCSMHPGILTIGASLNGDQLCGHVYVADLITVITVADNR